MADTSERSIADKLAAAKKKHKAFLKEKGLKTGKKNEKTDEIAIAKSNDNDKLQEDFEHTVPQNQENKAPTENSLPNFTFQDPVAFFDTFSNNVGESENNSNVSNFFQSYNSVNIQDNTISDKEFTNNIENIESNNEIQYSSGDNLTDAQNDFILTPIESQFPNNQILNELPKVENKEKSDLEKQNLELLAIIDQQNLKTIELHSELQNMTQNSRQLQMEYQNLISASHHLPPSNAPQNFEELNKLRDELKCHVQTIQMLVAEKSELTNTVSELQSQLKSQSAECLDLNEKCQNAHYSIFNLEKELQTLKLEKQHYITLQKELESNYKAVLNEHQDLRENRDDLNQELIEIKSKLKFAEDANANYQKNLSEVSNQLNMANLKIQQLSLNGTSATNDNIEKIIKEKQSLESEIINLNEMIKLMTKEKQESNSHYQHYAQQLSDQVTNLTQKVEQYQKENEVLKMHEESRIRHMGDLERQLQHLQNDSTSFNVQRNNVELKRELDQVKETLTRVVEENTTLKEDHTKIAIERNLLIKELELSKNSIQTLENTVEHLKGTQPDNAILLATMESDKIAASKAISQNNEIKKQIDSMQEVMMKVNNTNVELTENLTAEQKTNRELMEKLQKTELALQTLVEAVEVKDKEMISLRHRFEEMQKETLQNEQLTDRLRHYEVKEHSAQSLEVELETSKKIIQDLKWQLESSKNNSEEVNSKETSTELTDIEIMRRDLNQLKVRNEELEAVINNKETNKDSNDNEALDKDTAMKHLEKKFLQTMENIAKLTEEKQRLEHLVLQLQGETETIGEYVALYQLQRSVLKQKALEKDQELQRLTNDRENIKSKLEKLNNLVNKLVSEKGAITEELLLQHKELVQERDDLCAEHAKIHQQINKITLNSIDSKGVTDSPNFEIANEIITLLSEIKNSNLVQPSEQIHHCAWCSGQLVTV